MSLHKKTPLRQLSGRERQAQTQICRAQVTPAVEVILGAASAGLRAQTPYLPAPDRSPRPSQEDVSAVRSRGSRIPGRVEVELARIADLG